MQNEVDRLERFEKISAGAKMASCIGILICTTFSSTSAHAESLGGMKVLSTLNQPLRLQVGLNSIHRIDTSCAQAHMESIEGDSLGGLDMRIVNDGVKQAMMLETHETIPEPAVNVVVQMNCGAQEERTYPVLLDLAQPKSAAEAAPVPVMASQLKISSEIDRQLSGKASTDIQADGKVKLQLARSLSGLNPLAIHPGTIADATMTGNDHSQEEPHLVLAGVNAIGAQAITDGGDFGTHNGMHKYWQPGLGIFAALMGLLIWSFWRSARRVSIYSTRKTIKKTAKRPVTKQVKSRMLSTALDPIPYAKPDMSFFAAPNTVLPRAAVNRDKRSIRSVAVAPTSAKVNDQSVEDMDMSPPLYSAEEVVDEAQLSKLWMGLNQPLKAIELFESYWGQNQPASPLPWRCLLELYRTTGNLNKYRELIGRYNSVFGENAAKRNERNEHIGRAEEGLRRSA